MTLGGGQGAPSAGGSESSLDTQAGAARLKRLRIDAGLTQEQLAEASHVSVRTIRGLECGSGGVPRRATVERVAGALGLAGRDATDLVALFTHGRAMKLTTLWPPLAADSGATAPDIDEVRDGLNRGRRILAQSVDSLRGPDGHCLSYDVTATIQAQEDGLDRLVPMRRYDPAVVDVRHFTLDHTENCRPGATHVYASANVKTFELLLGRPLAAGEYHTYRTVYGCAAAGNIGALGEPEEVRFVLDGMFLSLRVRFTPPAVPTRVRHVWRETGDSEPEHIADVPVNAFNTAQMVVESTRTGFDGLVWEWPDLG